MRRVTILSFSLALSLLLIGCGGNSVRTPISPTQAPPADGGNGGVAGGGGDAGTDGGNVTDGNFDPFPFGTPVPGEGEDEVSLPVDDAGEEDEPEQAATLIALGAPLQPTLAATTQPFGGAGIDPELLGSPGEAIIQPPDQATDFDPNDPESPTIPDPASLFDELSVRRVGGPGGQEQYFQIFQDGSVLIDGQLETVITPQQVIELDQLLDGVSVFDISGTFIATFPDSDAYIYVISVIEGDRSISHRADDDLIPPQLSQVVTAVIDAASGR
jgi:hypothetical protein